MHSERIVEVFRSHGWEDMNINVNEFTVNMKMIYAKPKTNKSAKNFVHFSLCAMRKEIINHNIHNNHDNHNNHNIQVFGQTIWS